MRKGNRTSNNNSNINQENTSNKNNNGFLRNSLRMIDSCVKTVAANANTVAATVKHAAASISPANYDHKDLVTWAGFDKLELSPSVWRHVLLLGYQMGFQVVDVDDASNFSELVSRRDDGPVTFLQMQPIPLRSNGQEGFWKSHPLLLVVGCRDESNASTQVNSRSQTHFDYDAEDSFRCQRIVKFYSLTSHSYVHVLRFRSNVCMVRCSSRIVAIGLEKQICCFDALTLENKFSVLTYPVPQMVGYEKEGVNIGCGPMAIGPRWLAYAPNDQLVNTPRLSPQTLKPSPVASPSTSPSGGIVGHYAVESGKHLAAGIVTLGGKGYKTLSKYCHELLPDDSNSGLRTARPDTDNAGQVVVMDLISKTALCRFKAHSTPISALCFDPSGTLLVTASVHGNSINVFRIMPCRNINGSVSRSDNSSSSSVHLYKFRRGIRAAIIQDICFSCFSQWVAIVSSKGTCHVFVLSPFGGDVGFQNVTGQTGDVSVTAVLTLPWWSASTRAINQQPFQPPPPVTLSVVSRIKDNTSSMLNTVPAGALAAVFHNSLPRDSLQVQTTVRSLEHLMVYTPSGHIVQHEIQPSLRIEGDAELSITINPVQWWDVCRRSNESEQEGSLSEILLHGQQVIARDGKPLSGTYKPKSNVSNTIAKPVRNKSTMDSASSYERHLSNAEVQYSNMNLPVWQKSKLSFCMISSSRVKDHKNGEYEIEKFPVSELEKRRKDLLPVFDHFHSMRSALNDRGYSVTRRANVFNLTEDKYNQETVICHSKPASFSSRESSDGGTSRQMDHLLDLDHLNEDHTYMPYYHNTYEHDQEKTENVVNDLSFLETMRSPENMMPTDFSREHSDAVNNSVDADVPASASQSLSSRVVSDKETSELQFADGGMSIEKVFNKKFEPFACLEETKGGNNAVVDSSMELTKEKSSNKDGLCCSVLTFNEECRENTNEAEDQDATASVNNCEAICNLDQFVTADVSASAEYFDVTSQSTNKQIGTEAAYNTVLSQASSTKVDFIQKVGNKIEYPVLCLGEDLKTKEQGSDQNSSMANSPSDDHLNQEKEGSVNRDSPALLGEVNKEIQPSVYRKVLEVKSNASVSRLDNLDEENVFQVAFPLEECRNNAYSRIGDLNDDRDDISCSLSDKNDLDDVEENDMLGAIFPFSEEGTIDMFSAYSSN